MSLVKNPSHLPSTLADHEAVIERGLQSFVEVGNALMAIKIDKLYKQSGYASFEDYCERRWSIGRQHGYRLVAAAATVEALAKALPEVSPTGDIPLPARESQVRELAGLTDAEKVQVWTAAVEQACGVQPTAEQVKAAVAEVKDPAPPHGIPRPSSVKVTVRESKSTTTEGVNPVTGEVIPFPTTADSELLEFVEDNPSVLDMGPNELREHAAAIEEFPFLDDYPLADVMPTAEALRAIPEGPERDRRIEAAKTWPAAVAAADQIASIGEHPNAAIYRGLIETAIDAAKALHTFACTPQDLGNVDPDEMTEWAEGLTAAAKRIYGVAQSLANPTTTLRRVK